MLTVSINDQTFRVKDCRGFSKYRGLMFDRLKDKDGALLNANAIWMLFTLVKLDLLFIRDNRIIDVQRAVPVTLNPKTWRIYKNPAAKLCLELKTGTGINPGDQVIF